MGAGQSNISREKVNDFKTNKNGIEIIDIDFGDLLNSESDASTLNQVFEKLDEITNTNVENPNVDDVNSSPFVSTEMFNKIMNGESEGNSSSPFVNTEKFNKIMEGGNNSDSDSDSDKDIVDEFFDDDFLSVSRDEEDSVLKEISDIMVTSEDIPTKKHNKKHDKKHDKKHNKKKVNYSTSSEDSEMKKYGFSETSSEIIRTSDNNYYINDDKSSETPYKIDSSEINTSDINLVSVDSRNGRRFI